MKMVFPLTALFFLVNSAANAQIYELPRLTVIGNSSGEILSSPGSAHYVEQDEIKRKQPQSLLETVSATPGVHIVDTDGQGALPRISMRGLNPDMSKKVLILEDGVPVNLGPFVDPATYYTPTLDRMQRVEILKGSSSLRYGPSTIGGTINFITKEPRNMQNSYTLYGGSRDQVGVLFEGAKALESSATSITVGRKAGEGNRKNNNFDITDVVVKHGMALSDSHYIGTKFSYFQNDLGATYLGLTEAMYKDDAYQNPAENDQLNIQRIGFDVNHSWSLSDKVELQTLVYGNTTTRDWWRENFTLINGDTSIQMSGTTSGRLRTFQNVGIDSRLTWKNSLWERENKTEIGVRLHAEKMTNQRVDGATATSRSGTIRDDDLRSASAQAVYLINTTKIGNLELVPGVRLESYKLGRDIRRLGNADVNQSNSTTNTEVMPGLGMVYHMSVDTSAFFGIHKGFSPPRVEDAIDGTGASVDLDAERSVNTELGIRRKSQEFSYELTLFQLDFGNQLIQASQAGGATSQLTNAGKSLHQGAEAAAEVALTGPLYLGVTWTYIPTAKLNSRRIINGEDRNGNRLPYAPENIGLISLGVRTLDWSGEIQAHHTSKQYTDFENTNTPTPDGRRGAISERTVINLAGQYRLSKDYELFGSIKNVADEKYIASRAPQGIFPGLQRTVLLGVRGTF